MVYDCSFSSQDGGRVQCRRPLDHEVLQRLAPHGDFQTKDDAGPVAGHGRNGTMHVHPKWPWSELWRRGTGLRNSAQGMGDVYEGFVQRVSGPRVNNDPRQHPRHGGREGVQGRLRHEDGACPSHESNVYAWPRRLAHGHPQVFMRPVDPNVHASHSRAWFQEQVRAQRENGARVGWDLHFKVSIGFVCASSIWGRDLSQGITVK